MLTRLSSTGSAGLSFRARFDAVEWHKAGKASRQRWRHIDAFSRLMPEPSLAQSPSKMARCGHIQQPARACWILGKTRARRSGNRGWPTPKNAPPFPDGRWKPTAGSSSWLSFVEPKPSERKDGITAPHPIEQLLLTKDETDYCWYSIDIQATSARGDAAHRPRQRFLSCFYQRAVRRSNSRTSSRNTRLAIGTADAIRTQGNLGNGFARRERAQRLVAPPRFDRAKISV